ncbi:Coiled-coil domain-containing protein 77 [Coelomomyces lativittatus]|nr:Coiled-coil domain-containing protein 77 [Coelomomyces lativittatus]KAJ1513738.1 Coiled-coil domain-containing protein 77 [Coelomomyces lativittatus]KAJ1514172.1 Coiled-coil domain-containing protein 77 [Coelomomyces lativittatus]
MVKLYGSKSSSTTSNYQASFNGLPLSQELISYYRQRIENSENELQSYIRALDTIKISHEEQHQLQWELQHRNEEIHALQGTLSEHQNSILEERQKNLRLFAENDELRVQELKDRRKMRYLLSLCGPSNDPEITYFKATLAPSTVKCSLDPTADPRASGAFDTGDTANTKSDSKKEGYAAILAIETEALTLEIKALKGQLSEQRQFHEEAMERVKTEMQLQREEEQLRTKNDAKVMADMVQKVKKFQACLRENTKELLMSRKNFLLHERLLKEERSKLVEELTQLRSNFQELKTKSDQVEKTIEQRILKKNETLLFELRMQLSKYEEALRQANLELQDRDAGANKTLKVLQEKFESLHINFKALQKRRKYEIEGFTNDILTLRKHVRNLEQHISKYGSMEDKELAILSIAKDSNKKAENMQKEITYLKKKMHHVESDIHRFAI